MKYSLLIIALIFSSFSTKAQTVDEIIDNYFENIGGKEAWAKLEGIKMNASVNQRGMDIPIEFYNYADGKQLMKFHLQGKDVVDIAFDGESAWGTNFMNMKAEPKTTEEIENIKRELGNFPDPFLNYKEKGFSCEMMGKETVEGVECFKLKLTKKPLLVDGVETPNETFYFFDPDNFVPILMEQEITEGEMKGKIAQEIFSDFQEVDGLYFPYSIDNKIKGTEMSQLFVVNKVELNPELDATMFVMPVETEVEAPVEGK